METNYEDEQNEQKLKYLVALKKLGYDGVYVDDETYNKYVTNNEETKRLANEYIENLKKNGMTLLKF